MNEIDLSKIGSAKQLSDELTFEQLTQMMRERGLQPTTRIEAVIRWQAMGVHREGAVHHWGAP